MRVNDQRVKMMSEVLRGVKVIKMNAWEESFMEKIDVIRKKELAIMRKTVYITTFNNAFSHLSPFLVNTLPSSVPISIE